MNQINSFFKPLGSSAKKSSSKKVGKNATDEKAIESGKGEKRSHKLGRAIRVL